jgi:hypothetical protein
MPRRSTEKTTPRSAPSRLSRFEVFLGNAWQAFEGKVTRTKTTATIVRTVTPEGQKPFTLTTVFHLSQLPGYSFA